MNDKIKGYLLGAIGAAAYGLNPLFALPLYADGMDADSVLFFRYLFATPMVAIMIKTRGRDFSINKGEAMMLVFMGILMVLSSVTLYYSYTYMDAGIASTLLFIYPILVAVIMGLFFKERLKPLTICCIVVALSGIALLYNKSDGSSLSLTGFILVMASAITYAVYIVGVNQSSLKDVATLKVTFYVLLIGTVFLFLRLMAGTGITTPTEWHGWGRLAALALFTTTVSFLCTTEAIKHIGSTMTSILGSLEPVTAVIIGITVFGEVIGGKEWLGLVLIVGAVTVVVANDRIAGIFINIRKLFPRIRKHRQA